MPLLIAQSLGVTSEAFKKIVIQLNKMEVKVISFLKDVQIQLTLDP
jgi:hypothetical protein